MPFDSLFLMILLMKLSASLLVLSPASLIFSHQFIAIPPSCRSCPFSLGGGGQRGINTSSTGSPFFEVSTNESPGGFHRFARHPSSTSATAPLFVPRHLSTNEMGFAPASRVRSGGSSGRRPLGPGPHPQAKGLRHSSIHSPNSFLSFSGIWSPGT